MTDENSTSVNKRLTRSATFTIDGPQDETRQDKICLEKLETSNESSTPSVKCTLNFIDKDIKSNDYLDKAVNKRTVRSATFTIDSGAKNDGKNSKMLSQGVTSFIGEHSIQNSATITLDSLDKDDSIDHSQNISESIKKEPLLKKSATFLVDTTGKDNGSILKKPTQDSTAEMMVGVIILRILFIHPSVSNTHTFEQE